MCSFLFLIGLLSRQYSRSVERLLYGVILIHCCGGKHSKVYGRFLVIIVASFTMGLHASWEEKGSAGSTKELAVLSTATEN